MAGLPSTSTGSRHDATQVARASAIVFETFDVYRAEHSAVTRRARSRFERRDWAGLHADAAERLGLYATRVRGALQDLDAALGPALRDRAFWHEVRGTLQAAIAQRRDAEIGATFFNSVVRRALGSIAADRETEFVFGLESHSPPPVRLPVPYRVEGPMSGAVRRVLGDLAWAAPWANLPRDAAAVATRIEAAWLEARHPRPDVIEVLPHVFYRGTRAFVVGRVRGEHASLPLALALRHGPDGIAVDAALVTENAVSIVFSFTRAYFHVEDADPAAMVTFLQEIMPRKPRGEIYTALGFFKHGKTLLYRDLVRHFAASDDRFILAPGAKGMVMAAFTLPSMDVVFKVIRDRFEPPKTATRRDVMERYALVFAHDRAGRLVDAQEYEHLAFPRERFEPDLLADLRESCPSMLHEDGAALEIRHLYTERRLVPLDLYLRRADPHEAHEAILDYGQAIKDLAATNIFPGDLLLKNFGVTRHKRVVFYDYDELCPLVSCRFRHLPVARDEEDEMGAEPWYHVAENDVFPEEFLTFLGLSAGLQPAFREAHGDLLDVRFWESMQDRHLAGETVDILPYREADRLSH